MGLNQWLEGLQEELVIHAEDLVRALGDRAGEEGNSQLSLALQVAEDAGSMRVLLNWLRYQASREATSRFWQTRAGEETLFALLEARLTELQRRAEAEFGGEPALARQAAVAAAARFLGFLRRAYIGREFLRSGGGTA